jgi:hypothetical protein
MSDFNDGTVGKGWSLNNPGSEPFPDPFMDYASTVMPENIRDALKYCEFIFNSNSMIRESARRVLSYFITDIEVKGLNGKDIGDDEKEKYEDFMNESLDIKTVMHSVGLDYLCYGNSFTTLIVPFRRYLSCPKCSLDVPLRQIMSETNYNFKWKMPEFSAVCPKCEYAGAWKRTDRRTNEPDEVRVRRWPAIEMEIRYDPIRDNRDYLWRIPEDYRTQVKRGDPQVLETVPWEVVEAVQANGFLLFDKGAIYHMYEPTLSGIRSRGWGISRTLVNFRHAWYCQVLHRYNEAIALDYVIPFRVLSPAPSPTAMPEGGDPLMNMDLGGLRGQVQAMLRKRRKDPASWHFLSTPIQYQALGGEAKNLAPNDLMESGINMLLNGFGMPAELYRGSLTMQSALPAIRLFESSWVYLVHSMNAFLRELTKDIGDAFGWEPATCKFIKPTMLDDVQLVMSKMQLMQAQQVSQTGVLRSLGMDFKDEQRQIMQEERFKQEEQAKMQEAMDKSSLKEQMAPPVSAQIAQGGDPAAAGAPPAGGAPAAGGAPPAAGGPALGQGGGQPAPQGPAGAAAQNVSLSTPTAPGEKVTPQDMQAKAESIANQLLAMPESQRQSEMTKLKSQDPVIHSLVKQTIVNIRQQAQSAGARSIMQQQYGVM